MQEASHVLVGHGRVTPAAVTVIWPRASTPQVAHLPEVVNC
jgi:hypothetical protein